MSCISSVWGYETERLKKTFIYHYYSDICHLNKNILFNVNCYSFSVEMFVVSFFIYINCNTYVKLEYK